jgi:7,8-dihydropterin-6-yl-methyl-4-(beta-D-ribofuranosyl)aminobenzene 5'-phosphate synthase
MKLTVLVDNHTTIDHYHYGEPGLCYYIEDGGQHILFDMGYSHIFLLNADSLGIDLGLTNTIVLSHGHNDHTGGLRYFLNGYPNVHSRLVTHPDALTPKIFEGKNIGMYQRPEYLVKRCDLILSREPVAITERLIYLGEIPQRVDFEPRAAIGTRGKGGPEDTIPDDSALVYRGDAGLTVITGCSHSGICNIIEQAKAVTGESRVAGVIGGFHLFKLGERSQRTIAYFEEQGITGLYPCHCTSFRVRCAINAVIPLTREIGVGMRFEWK